ncbi:hypothetical protein VTH06DRAFT_7184 [Thermothelomyces fergusii]
MEEGGSQMLFSQMDNWQVS